MNRWLWKAFLPFLGMPFADEGEGDTGDGEGGNGGEGGQGGEGGEEGGAGQGQGQGGSGSGSWKDSLPQEIREEAGFDKFEADTLQNSYIKLYKSYRNVEKKIGEKGVIKPKNDASPEEWASYYNALGRPEKAEDYDLKLPEGYTDSDRNPNFEKAIREALHEAGVSQAGAEKIYARALEANKLGLKAVNDAREKLYTETANALKKEWGASFDANKALVARAVEKFGGKELIKFFDDNPVLGNNAPLTKALYNMVKVMSDDVIEKGGISDLVTTPSQAKARLAEIEGNKNHPYWKGDKDAIQQYQDLLAIAEGLKK